MMTQENKEPLLKDLCARLPYNPMVEYKGETYNVLGIAHERLILCKPFMSHTLDECPLVEEVKPYLFPLSSMTEEQNLEYLRTCKGGNAYYPTSKSFDWCNENHFDYRGLIEKGLAIDATNKKIY